MREGTRHAEHIRGFRTMSREPEPTSTLGPPRIAAVITTWNRSAMVQRCIESVLRQTFPLDRIDLIVVDNASTDSTIADLIQRWSPERVLTNNTERASEPQFDPPANDAQRNNESRHATGLASFIIVRNKSNLGGTGGFNTGMAAVDRFHSATDRRGPLKYLWLLDDDAEIHPDALRLLVEAAERDPGIGLVGARSVDLEDRKTTLETTVHFCRETGDYFDHAPSTHPRHATFDRWVKEVGGTRGDRPYSGLIETDVAAACCLLARWEAVQKLGFWDDRFFIYEDDAEWCLRFQNAGYKVICNLDTIAYHTTWHRKFTPRLAAMRLYYSNRNRLWLLQKILKGGERQKVMTAWFKRLLNHAKFCAMHRMMMHAELTRRAVHDALTGRDGKLDLELPALEPLESAFERAGAFRPGAAIAVICDHPDYPRAAADLRERLHRIARANADKHTTRVIEVIRNDIPESQQPAPPGVERIVYSSRTRSKIRRQLALLANPPAAAVVFDHHCDFPLARCDWTIHIDLREPEKANLERDTIADRLGFLRAWRKDRTLADRFLADLQDYVAPNRFG